MTFKMKVVSQAEAEKQQHQQAQGGKCIGCLYFHPHPEHFGRFTGKINEHNVASFPNRSKTSEEQADWNITSNKETGYKHMGILFYNEATETFTGEFNDIDLTTGEIKIIDILVKKYMGKLKGKKAPDYMVVLNGV